MRRLDGNQIRHLIDIGQLFTTLRAAQTERQQRFGGAMSWKTVRGREYLYRKQRDRWVSLGPRSEVTELSFARFHAGRTQMDQRIAQLDDLIRAAAPVGVALRLGRVPWITARILRRLDREHLLGRGLLVAGTHALYAYEMLSGCHFGVGELATQDVDLLYDARRKVALARIAGEEGLSGLLRRVDRSFRPTSPGSFRAVNDRGFMVDLIAPLPRDAATAEPTAPLGTDPDDLRPVEIEGLAWLQHSPRVEAVCLDEKGYPLLIAAADPRAFALHKLWLSERADRDPIKRGRDRSQAAAVAGLVMAAMPERRFDAPELSALPAELRALTPRLAGLREPAEREDWD